MPAPTFPNPQLPVPNNAAPVAHCPLDPVVNAVGAAQVASYAVCTAGTTIVPTGRTTPGGIFHGAMPITGTPVYQAFDVFVSPSAGTTTYPLTALTTGVLGTAIPAGPPGVGVRFFGTLVIVVTGTSTTNTLWD